VKQSTLFQIVGSLGRGYPGNLKGSSLGKVAVRPSGIVPQGVIKIDIRVQNLGLGPVFLGDLKAILLIEQAVNRGFKTVVQF